MVIGRHATVAAGGVLAINGIEIRLLGPLELVVGGNDVALRGLHQREVVALLALHPNEVVSRDALIDELWEGDPPETATKIVQNAVSQLRKALAGAGRPAAIETEIGGYLLRVDPERIDVRRFERLAGQGRARLAAGYAAAARPLLAEALHLWRGAALGELAGVPFAQAEAARLEELRLAAVEDRIDSELMLGLHADVAAELEALVVRYPLRERLRGHLMLALYRLGRQADALAVYQDTRRTLVGKLGIEPSPFLHRLERAILRQDPELEAPSPGATAAPTPAPAARAARKTVAVLAAEIAPATTPSDPEALARAVEPALEAAERVVEGHGATVQRLPGGSILAVYGVPAVREDDTLRAARAALELRRELMHDCDRDSRVRIGVASGQVLVDPTGHVSGEPVVTAVHLQQRAAQGDILVGAGTERLLRGAGALERVDAADEEPIWRLLGVTADAPAARARLDAPLVGRTRELGQLRQVFTRATTDWAAQLVTVLGPAGIGKSRLSAEFVRTVADEATVLSGRCASYGEGITFRPLAEMLESELAHPDRLPRQLADVPGASLFLSQTAGAIGLTERSSTPTETFWAVRRLLEALARRQPLVVVVDDLQWAEPLFLDLVEHIAESARTAPIVVLCLARPDLLDDHPGWGGGKANGTIIVLEPLSESETDALIDELPGGRELELGLRTRLAEAAEGNPLFLEQTLALLGEEPPTGERLPVPATIQALLAARLDRLPPRERLVLEQAAVIGRDFELEALRHLVPALGADDVAADVSELIRKDLIRPVDEPDGAAAFRFRHSLIRTEAYESLPKEERARLHEVFASWLEEREAATELVGFHLEQAYRFRAELLQDADATAALGRRAAAALADAGRRASTRGDVSAAAALLSRAADTMDATSPARLEVLADLAEALRESGAFSSAQERAIEVAAAAAAAGDQRLEAQATIIRLRSQLQTDPSADTDAIGVEATRAVAVFETARDDARLAKTWELLAWTPWRHGQVGAAETALRRAIHHARRADDRRTEAQGLYLLIGAALYGPMPVSDGIEFCTGILAREDEQLRIRATALRALAAFRAMEGAFDEARVLLAEERAILQDLGLVLAAAFAAEASAFVELLAGDQAAAEREARSGYETLERLGETSNSSNLAAMVAHALAAQGRHQEALSFTALSEHASGADDVSPQVLWRTARAKALAATGRGGDAEVLAREAVILAERTDFVLLHADALVDLAEVLRERKAAGASEPLERALRLYDGKGNLVAAERIRAPLAPA